MSFAGSGELNAGFLSGNGEVERSQSLRLALGIVLHSKFPMLLFWGDDHLSFYNDAYSALLGAGKHQKAPGKKGKENWPEIWPVLKTMIEGVKKGAEATWHEDLLLPANRNGSLEDKHWTFSYSGVYDEQGKIEGVLVTGLETTDVTENVLSKKKLEESAQNLKNIIAQAPVGMLLLRGPEFVVEVVNEKILEQWGRTYQQGHGRPLLEVLPEIRDQGFSELLQKVYNTGEPYTASEKAVTLIRNGERELRYSSFTYEAYREQDGIITGVMAVANDVTNEVIAKQKIKDSELFASKLIHNSLVAQCVWIGYDMVFSIVNEKMLEIFGRDSSIIGMKYMDAIPELIDTPLMSRLRHVLKTGETFRQPEEKFTLLRNGVPYTGYYTYTYQVLTNAAGENYGVICNCNEVTENVNARKIIEESEQRFRILADSMQNLCWMAEADGHIFWYNKRWYDYTGTNLEEMKGWGWQKVHHPDHIERILAFMKEAWLRPEPIEITFPLRRYDGEYRWFLTRVFPLLNEDGTIYRWVGTNTDITEGKVAGDRFRTLAESLPQLVWMTDANGNYEYASSQWQSYSGIDPYSEHAWNRIVHEGDNLTVAKHWEESLRTGNRYSAEIRLKNKKDEYRWHSVQGEPIRNEEGMIVNWIGAFTDIHEQKTIAQQLEILVNDRTKELQRSNEDLQRFAHVASHDLKEPVRKIKTFANRLQSESNTILPPKSQGYLEKIQNATDRMYQMIEGVLTYSESNTPEASIGTIDLNELFATIMTDLEILIHQKKAIISKKDLPVIEGAKVLIYQLFYNIVNNALKFSKTDRNPEILISSQTTTFENKEMVIITIADNGIGFENMYSRKIFDTFTRLNSKDKFEGTGLGLALCERIVERHNGTIQASGNLGVGATFHISLPLKQLNFI